MFLLRVGISVVLVLAVFIGHTHGKQLEEDILDRLLKDYNPQVRPPGENGTVVTINTYLRTISALDDAKMDYSVQLTFRQQWRDSRLAYSPSGMKRGYLSVLDSDRVWIPDLFFSNEKSGHIHNLIKPNQYVRIFPDGEVLYSTRIALTLSCPMILKLYPFDRQTCSLRMASYGYTTDDIIFKWKTHDPVQITPELHLPLFALDQFATDSCDSQTNTGVYSCLRVDFLFKRELNYYLIQVFIPCTMLVLMAGCSFWLSKTEIVGRLLLILVTQFLMILGIHFMNFTLPTSKVSYTRAIDVWTGSCLTFLFAALLESITVNFLSRQESPAFTDSTERAKGGWNIRERFRTSTLADKIDMAARIIYPIAFVLFVLAYLGTYCTTRGEDLTGDDVKKQPEDD